MNKIVWFVVGIRNETSNTTFICTCQPGWQGIYCETKINYCENVTCFNNGICQPSLLNYTCQCLGQSYSGQHCEITSSQIVAYEIVSKSFACIAIIAMIGAMMFVVIMDVLKHHFGIDPVGEELEKIEKAKQAKKNKPPVIIRYISAATGIYFLGIY
jgi:hypothetical protein